MTQEPTTTLPAAPNVHFHGKTGAWRLLAVGAFAMFFAPVAESQLRFAHGVPIRAVSPKGSDVYPTGDAVDVYRAVLDLLYIDGQQRAPLILLWDTAQRAAGGPCGVPNCKKAWPHKSKIDTATILAYAQPRLGRPRIIDFGYPIPIKRVSSDDFERIRHEGHALLANFPQDKVGPLEAFWAGFKHKYPEAWGWVTLGTVAFDPKHTEALIGVMQVCGPDCRSIETMYLKRAGGRWRVVERIPETSLIIQTSGNLRYRGPAGERPEQSQILADEPVAAPRGESDDAVKIYRAVLDRLYSFYGERPEAIVIMETHGHGLKGLPTQKAKVDSGTLASYNFAAQVRDAVYPRFRYRLPITWLSHESLEQLERDGSRLAAAATERAEQEQSPLWHAFQARYPGAWGYLTISKVGFNPQQTQALVSTQHFCGSGCQTGDVWLLQRKNESWSIVERIPGERYLNWTLDGLRYLGPNVDPTWYRPRRVRGALTDLASGKPVSTLTVEAKFHNHKSRFVTTDTEGRYSLADLPVGAFMMKVGCSARSDTSFVMVGPVIIRPGLDSTANFAVDFAPCPHNFPQAGQELAPKR